MNQNPNDKVLNFKVQNDTSYYFDMLQKIASASKYTAETHGWNVLEQLRNALFEIMCYGNYRWFTREYEIREKMQKYTPDDYFNFMYDFIRMQNPNYLDNYDIAISFGQSAYDKSKYFISESDLKKMIKDFCIAILEPLVRNCQVNLSLFYFNDVFDYKKGNIQPQDFDYNPLSKDDIFDYKKGNIQSQNVVYNPPSNECRKAVLDGTQTETKNSSFCGYGMYSYSDIGKYRHSQEDSYYIGVHPSNPDFKLMVVADGIGGGVGGNVASNIAVKEIISWFEKLPSQEFYNSNSDLKHDIINILSKIDKKIQAELNKKGGTTICFSLIKQNSVFMVNVGDSSGYVIENDKLIYATTPDNLVSNINGFPKQLMRYHKDSSVINSYLGGKWFEPNNMEFMDIQLHSDSKYKIILCSDGVTDCLSESDIVYVADIGENPAKTLVETSIENTSYLENELNSLSKTTKDDILHYFSNSLYDNIPGGIDNTTAVVADIPKRKK